LQAAIDARERSKVGESQPDIDAIKQLLVTIGISHADASRHAKSLVLDHKVNSMLKFQRKVGSDVAGYSALLQLDTDDVELLEEYFKQHANVSTPPAMPPRLLSAPATTGGSSVPTTGGGAAKHWNCFMTHNWGIGHSLLLTHSLTHSYSLTHSLRQ